MDNILQRFPDIGEAIFCNIDDKSLVTCKKASETWKSFIEKQKLIWIKMIEKHIGKWNTFSDDWKKVISKTPTHMVRRLALTVEEFCQNEKFKKKYCPLFIATNQNNLLLAWHIIK